MEERIREYQDTQGIRVESNGEYTINDDESQRSEKEPEVDITYTLNCSEDFCNTQPHKSVIRITMGAP